MKHTNYRLLSILLFSLSLAACSSRVTFEQTKDYSALLPSKQMLYLSLSVQAAAQQHDFPYHEIIKKILHDQPQVLQQQIAKRLQRSQVAWSSSGELHTINQLRLPRKTLLGPMEKQPQWQAVQGIDGGLYSSAARQTLMMPEDNLLFFGKASSPNLTLNQLENIAQTWQMHQSQSLASSAWPQPALDLQEQKPLVLYSAQVASLLLNPLVTKGNAGLSAALAPLAQQVPINYLMLWVGPAPPSEDGESSKGLFLLELEVDAGNALLAKGLETGARFVIPSLLARSKQPFLKQQLSKFRLSSQNQYLRFSLPLDSASVISILDNFSL